MAIIELVSLGVFCLGWWGGGGGQEGEMTSCSQNSLGVGGWLGIEQERMYQLGLILIHISIPKGRHRDGK